MILIYSDKEIKGISGVYCSPRLFDGVDTRAELIVTNNQQIAEAYKAVGVDVKGFPRASKPKAETE